jgi:2-aminoadipate transaminase
MTVASAHRTWTDKFAIRTGSTGGGALAAILALSGRKDIISFAGGLPDPATLPDATLGDLVRDVIASGDASALQYAPVRGLPRTLDYVAERLKTHEGRSPAIEELMITSGCIEALELLGKTFLDAGDAAIVEAPTYLGAFMGFQSFQATVLPVPMDHEGIRIVPLGEAMTTVPHPKLLYTIPDYQNPTGRSLSLQRRKDVIELACRYDVIVIEDVTYRELGYYGDRLPSLWTLCPDVVVQIGTFSKTFFPGVRLGWAVGPPDVIAQMVLAKQNTDQCAGALGQRLLEEYGRRGYLEHQIAQARTFYRRRRDRLMEALCTYMPEGVSWTEPGGGFVCWLTIPGGVDTDVLAERAIEESVAFVPGSVFYPDQSQGHSNLRLSFSSVQDADIGTGVRRLGMLLRQAMREARGGTE